MGYPLNLVFCVKIQRMSNRAAVYRRVLNLFPIRRHSEIGESYIQMRIEILVGRI